MDYIPKHMKLLPNTSGARNALEAVKIARIARASGCGNWVKIEVISDNKYLLPDGYETLKATVITSYSIHYTKLYDKLYYSFISQVFIARKPG